MCSLINKQSLLTAYAYLFIMEQQKVQQGSEALQVQMNTAPQEALGSKTELQMCGMFLTKGSLCYIEELYQDETRTCKFYNYGAVDKDEAKALEGFQFKDGGFQTIFRCKWKKPCWSNIATLSGGRYAVSFNDNTIHFNKTERNKNHLLCKIDRAPWEKVLDGIKELMLSDLSKQVVLSPPTLLLLESSGAPLPGDGAARGKLLNFAVEEDADVTSFIGAGLFDAAGTDLGSKGCAAPKQLQQQQTKAADSGGHDNTTTNVAKSNSDDTVVGDLQHEMIYTDKSTVGEWIAEKTKKQWDWNETVRNLPDNYRAALVYFKAKWSCPFLPVPHRLFKSSPTDSSNCPFMGKFFKVRGSLNKNYSESSELKIFSAPFGQDKKFRMLFFLPKKCSGAPGDIASLAMNWLRRNHNKWDLSWTDYDALAVLIPKFDTAYLEPNLSVLGGGTPVNSTMALTNIEWDEEGAQAKAGLEQTGQATGGKQTPTQFEANQPFIYALQGKAKGQKNAAVTQIVGVVQKPTSCKTRCKCRK